MWTQVLSALMMTTPFAASISSVRRKRGSKDYPLKPALDRIDHERHTLELIARGAPFKQVLDTLSEGIERLTGNCYCVIFFVDKEEKCLVEGSRGRLPAGPKFSENRLPLQPGSCLSSWSAASNEVVIVPDMLASTMSDQVRDFATLYDVRSCWCLPIPDASGAVVGVLAVYHHSAHGPSKQQLKIAESG